MDAAHIHLLLNHVPVLGAVFGLLVLGYAVAGGERDDVLRVGLWTLVVVGVASVVVYLTGEPAEELVEGLAGVSETILERHEEAALWATIGGGLVGTVALAALLWFRRKRVPRRVGMGILVLTLGLTGLMGWTANLGGQVRHTEIRQDAAATAGMADAAADATGQIERERHED